MTLKPDPLSRREREIMDIIFRLEKASVSQVRGEMAAAPSYSTVRTLMGTLEQKGQLKHTQAGPRYEYSPVVPRATAQRSALTRIVDSFFGGSPQQAAVALLEMSDIDTNTLDELRALVDQAQEEGR